MSETLYPHEAIEKTFNKNIFKIASLLFFICAGISTTLVFFTKTKLFFIGLCCFCIGTGLLLDMWHSEQRSLN